MDRDYHYDMMKVLSHHAGFLDREAQLIAYACQYIDDANEFVPIRLANPEAVIAAVPDVKTLGMIKDGKFDRVCTGHDDLQVAAGAVPSSQVRTYLPYHFVPTDTIGERTRGRDRINYRTSPNCKLVNELMVQAVDGVRASTAATRDQALIRLGIALHSYIDSWAHCYFSGLFSEADNASVKIRLADKNGVKSDISVSLGAALAPATGHASVHRFPDASHHVWDYYDREGVHRERDNPKDYLVAARNAYDYLLRASGAPNNWTGIEKRVYDATAYYPPSGGKANDPLSITVMREKKIHYVGAFPEVNLGKVAPNGAVADSYNKLEWKAEGYRVHDPASGKDIPVGDERLNATEDWGAVRSVEHAAKGSDPYLYTFLGDRRWLWFQVEAERHRRYVFSRIEMPQSDNANFTESLSQQVGAVKDHALDMIGRKVGLEAAVQLEEKKAWMRIAIQNKTDWDLRWIGDDSVDFKFADELVAAPDESSIFGSIVGGLTWGVRTLVNSTNKVIGDVGHGRYWKGSEPMSTRANTTSMFAMCENDNAINVAGGATVFELNTGRETVPLTISFSRPLLGDEPILCVGYGSNRLAVWRARGSQHTKPTDLRVGLSDGSVLLVSARPGKDSVVRIERITAH